MTFAISKENKMSELGEFPAMNSYVLPLGREVCALTKGREIKGLLSILVLAGTFLYVNLFLLPRTPMLMTGDQMFFWMDAQRMLHGDHAYRDFFQFTPPGTDLVYFAFFRIFGPHLWVTNAVVLLLGIALCAVCFFVTSGVMEQGPAVLATLLFLTLLYGRTLNATHHWFSMLLILSAAAIAIRGKSLPRTVVVGICLGAAAFFTQSHGLVAVLAFGLWLVWEELPARESWLDTLSRPATLMVSFAVSLLAFSAYFLVTSGASALWYCQVVYVKQYMVSGLSQFPGLAEFPTWRRLPIVGQSIFVCAMLPAVYPLAMLRSQRIGRNQSATRNGIMLLALLGLALFLEVLSSANWLRLYAVAIPGIGLLVWCANSSGRMRRAALGLIWLVVICLGLHQTWARQRQNYVVTETPGGRVAVDARNFAELNALKEQTRPGELLFQAVWPGFYIPLRLLNPVYVDTIWPNEESRPEFVERSIKELEAKQVPHILWSQNLDYPDPANPQSDHLGPLRDYLHEHYRRVQVFSDQDELWERK